MSAHLEPIPPPIDLDLFGARYHIAPYWVEEIVLLLRNDVPDAEILFGVQNPAGNDANSAETIPLTDGRCRELLAELKALVM